MLADLGKTASDLRQLATKALDQLCGGGDMHMRGGGCYSDSTPFPTLTNLTQLKLSNCVRCDLAPPPASEPKPV